MFENHHVIPVLTIILIASVLGGLGRRIQGGLLGPAGKGWYRPVAFSLYTVATALAFIPLYPALFNLGLLDYIILAVAPALLIYPHVGPKHGQAMDMGNVEGNLKDDFILMWSRFAIPNTAAAGILVLAPTLRLDYTAISLALVCFIPAGTYALCWEISKYGFKRGWTKPFQATVVAEAVYGGLYHAAIAGIISIQILIAQHTLPM